LILSNAQQEVIDLLKQGWALDVQGHRVWSGRYDVHVEDRKAAGAGWYRTVRRVWVHPSTFAVLVRKQVIIKSNGEWTLNESAVLS
jgi:lipoate-protein ligase A